MTGQPRSNTDLIIRVALGLILSLGLAVLVAGLGGAVAAGFFVRSGDGLAGGATVATGVAAGVVTGIVAGVVLTRMLSRRMLLICAIAASLIAAAALLYFA